MVTTLSEVASESRVQQGYLWRAPVIDFAIGSLPDSSRSCHFWGIQVLQETLVIGRLSDCLLRLHFHSV